MLSFFDFFVFRCERSRFMPVLKEQKRADGFDPRSGQGLPSCRTPAVATTAGASLLRSLSVWMSCLSGFPEKIVVRTALCPETVLFRSFSLPDTGCCSRSAGIIIARRTNLPDNEKRV
jgi:hypothetical protein